MPTIATSNRPDQVTYWDANQGAAVGRWCRAPFRPDRCSACCGKDLTFFPAEGFVSAKGSHLPPSELLNRDWGEYREGICRRCRPEAASPDYIGGVVETKFYFSGVAGDEELAMLQQAGVGRVMADQFDYPRLGEWQGIHKVLDCGAYRIFKSKGRLKLDSDAYLEMAEAEQEEVDFAIAPDVIGDPAATRLHWLETIEWLTQNLDDTPSSAWPRIIPVWSWGADLKLLDQYLSESQWVAIGGLVPLLRKKNKSVLHELVALCHEHLGRFHILGCNWETAIEQLFGLAASMDTSKWLDGARYRSCLFQHTRDKYLRVVPQAVMPEYKKLSRFSLCVQNAQNLQAFADDAQNLKVSIAQCDVCGGTFNAKGSPKRKHCTPECGRVYRGAGKGGKKL